MFRNFHNKFFNLFQMSYHSKKEPPNILVLAENENEFKKIKLFIQKILGKQSYTIYNISSNDLKKSSLWIPSCRLLVSSEQVNLSDEVLSNKIESLTNYMKIGGKIISIPSLNDNFERDQRIIQQGTIYFHKDKYLFESKYEDDLSLIKKGWQNDLINDENLFYAYNSNKNQGSHFITKVF